MNHALKAVHLRIIPFSLTAKQVLETSKGGLFEYHAAIGHFMYLDTYTFYTITNRC